MRTIMMFKLMQTIFHRPVVVIRLGMSTSRDLSLSSLTVAHNSLRSGWHNKNQKRRILFFSKYPER